MYDIVRGSVVLWKITENSENHTTVFIQGNDTQIRATPQILNLANCFVYSSAQIKLDLKPDLL